jgi:threonine dehydrogenase-like Zn-dependent dehydrogenase
MARRSTGWSTSATNNTTDVRKERCDMQGAVLHAAHDIRLDDRAEPSLVEPTDAIISLSATCICGSDLWPYRGIQPIAQPVPMGHEYCGVVEEVGRNVTSIKRGQFMIGSFFASDNTCPHCRAGYQTSCQHKQVVVGAQAPRLRVPLADGRIDRLRRRPARRRTRCRDLFYRHVHVHGGPAPVRRYLPQLIDLVCAGTIDPGKVFDLVLPLEQVAEGYRAMHERRAIKTLLRPQPIV